ncbi:MAG TPA: nucleotidyltransferase domain-containing protein [Bacteroidia bacterium]|nr:nucleotidyltransferase domain-containing protein [Bacteroidia bacterium]
MNKFLNKILPFIVKMTDPEMVLLFGSAARGDHNVHSDADFIVVTKRTFQRQTVHGSIKNYAEEFNIHVDILWCTPDEIEKARQNPVSFLATVHNSAKIVYKKNR